jgi:hypothetical protein
MELKIKSLRRITADNNHNAFTGACWFKGILYVAFRQGEAHVCETGRLVVMRSPDNGVSFKTVAVLRGLMDTRDAHLYTDGKRLYVVGFEYDKSVSRAIRSGAAWTENGLDWSPWTPYEDADSYVLWRPRFHNGRHYCPGYSRGDGNAWIVGWFESEDGYRWEQVMNLRENIDKPNECALDFLPDGSAAVLMRREQAPYRPLLLRASAPYREWTEQELDFRLGGPMLWHCGETLWISGRWFLSGQVAHLAVFELRDSGPELRVVMPSGPGTDCSYMSVAPHPDDPRRVYLAYYSGHVAPDNPAVDQWSHPDIYLAEGFHE